MALEGLLLSGVPEDLPPCSLFVLESFVMLNGQRLKGLYFYLYLILDVFSRKIVGWEIYAEESADHAAKTFHKAHLREGIGIKNLILHSDNGSPMKGATMLGMLQKLGVVPSFSRPSVSNDNPYSESLFKTMKYRPDFPERRFDTLDQARPVGFQLYQLVQRKTSSQRH